MSVDGWLAIASICAELPKKTIVPRLPREQPSYESCLACIALYVKERTLRDSECSEPSVLLSHRAIDAGMPSPIGGPPSARPGMLTERHRGITFDPTWEEFLKYEYNDCCTSCPCAMELETESPYHDEAACPMCCGLTEEAFLSNRKSTEAAYREEIYGVDPSVLIGGCDVGILLSRKSAVLLDSAAVQRVVLEVCAGPDSMMSRPGPFTIECRCFRITVSIDFASRRWLCAINVLRAYRHKVLVWFSMPCTGGCPFQYLN